MSANSARILPKLIAALVVLVAAGAAVIYFLRPIAKVALVTRGDTASIVPGSVVVDAERVSPIASEIEGKVKKTNAEPGKVVKEGEVLFELDTTDVEIEIAQAKSDFDAAKKNQAIALEINKQQWTTREEDWAAVERNYKQQKLSDADYAKEKRNFEIEKQKRAKLEADDQARVETLENALKVAQRKKEKMTIVAPFDGTITEVLARNNDLVAAKQALANIIALTRRVRAKISEENFPAVEVGQKAKVSFLGYHEQTFAATITQKLPAAEPDTQRYIAYLQVEIPPEKLLPNLTGEVGIIVGEHKNVVRVPRRAMWDGYVYVVSGGVAREQKLATDYTDYNFAEVKSGVKEGDTIIVEELDKFHDGQHVRPVVAP